MRELIILNTNLAVRTAISQMLEHKETEYLVLTDQPNIKQFLDFLGLDKCETCLLRSAFNIWQIKDIIHQKRVIKNVLDIDFTTVHFYHQAYGDLFNWIVYYCYRRCKRIEHHRVMPKMAYPWARVNLLDIAIIIQYWFFYKTRIRFMNEAGVHAPYIVPSFYKKYGVIESELKVNDDKLRDCTLKIIDRLKIKKEADVVLLTGSVIKPKRVNYDEYYDVITQLVKQVTPDKFVAKCHPRYDDELEEEKRLPHIPSFIPMGFLIDYFDYYVGYSSTVLREASLKGKRAISFINCLPSVDNDEREYWYSYFKGVNIHYPKSVEEICELLNN